ncbi:DUF2637 domain-containing protein [Streptosporangium roseum]|uniref:DUF2637 domain-containing protein n=1 Tax=Streptosporangium roseum (strain ATCC 12428 / DSM 43021 / JCM 3005 / KCTC 9067 / NCIMB 10171 / NRRL 2505 / NI 9100) TaxID=479432 RepID=D2AUG6_STRRD|nr:DUF2637 domain-containing protein [Streptosporangium roseum]ACZ84828.1 hypothetical protein Sros_1840 [Streptosporangium roseum DSM 43021]
MVIRFFTTAVVVLLAAVAAVVSYRHALEVVTANGESGLTAYLVPLTIDGAIFASSMVLLDAARRGLPVPALARWTLGLGILATLAANVATGWAHGPVGAIVAAWPAVALVLSYELLMGMIRRGNVPAPVVDERLVEDVEPGAVDDFEREADRLIASLFGDEVRVPAVPLQLIDSNGSADQREAGGAPVDEPGVEVQPPYVPESDDPLYPLALSHFLADVTEGEVPSVRTIKTRMSVGTDRARKLQAYLGQLVEVAA